MLDTLTRCAEEARQFGSKQDTYAACMCQLPIIICIQCALDCPNTQQLSSPCGSACLAGGTCADGTHAARASQSAEPSVPATIQGQGVKDDVAWYQSHKRPTSKCVTLINEQVLQTCWKRMPLETRHRSGRWPSADKAGLLGCFCTMSRSCKPFTAMPDR